MTLLLSKDARPRPAVPPTASDVAFSLLLAVRTGDPFSTEERALLGYLLERILKSRKAAREIDRGKRGKRSTPRHRELPARMAVVYEIQKHLLCDETKTPAARARSAREAVAKAFGVSMKSAGRAITTQRRVANQCSAAWLRKMELVPLNLQDRSELAEFAAELSSNAWLEPFSVRLKRDLEAAARATAALDELCRLARTLRLLGISPDIYHRRLMKLDQIKARHRFSHKRK